jgi:hypothetical protein
MRKQTVKSWRCGTREAILWEDDSVTLISEFDRSVSSAHGKSFEESSRDASTQAQETGYTTRRRFLNGSLR